MARGWSIMTDWCQARMTDPQRQSDDPFIDTWKSMSRWQLPGHKRRQSASVLFIRARMTKDRCHHQKSQIEFPVPWPQGPFHHYISHSQPLDKAEIVVLELQTSAVPRRLTPSTLSRHAFLQGKFVSWRPLASVSSLQSWQAINKTLGQFEKLLL